MGATWVRSPAVGVLLLLAGCTYRAVPQTPPPETALTAPARVVAGTWLLHVESHRRARDAALTGGFGCRAASYPVDAGTAFAEAVQMALTRTFDRVEPVEDEPGSAELRRARATGIIIVQPAQFEPRADIEQRGVGAQVRATTALAANVTADREFRRAFQGTIEAIGDAAVPIGLI